jgi:DNA adenine methylase
MFELPTPSAIQKTIWGSPAGKKRIAGRLAAMLPPHRTYVEPFAGSAAVLFAKEPSAVEAINDADPEIARAYQIVQRLRPRDIAALRKMDWVGAEKTYKALRETEPKTEVRWLHRFLYLSHFSYGKLRGKSFSPSGAGVAATTVDRIEKFAPRLAHVKVFGGDYKRVVGDFDGKDTAHFLDPPYAGYNVDVGEDRFDEHAFYDLLGKLQGKFLITYGIRGALPKLVRSSDFYVKRIRTPRTIRTMRGVGGSQYLTQLLIANYEPTKKSLAGLGADGWRLEDVPRQERVQAGPIAAPTPAFSKSATLLKGADPSDERFVLGVVLVPEDVDAQGDIYSAQEVRNTAHLFMEEYRGLGLMHRHRVNDQVKIVESYVAPGDFEIAGQSIRKGTWLLGVRVLSDALWEQVKDGTLGGFSIGGSARKLPEPEASKPREEEHAA